MTFLEQLIAVLRALPTSKKISMLVVLALVAAGFGVMFLWANQIDYQLLYGNLTTEDAGKIVAKLQEQRVPYKLTGGGTTILAPADRVYELRLTLANDGIPAGGQVGFEIFDQTNFSTTEFVQRLNYQRALQGELARTIMEFHEVDEARVLVVIPKDSLFVEDSKPPSASVLLKLRAPLSPDKVAGIVHLVSSAVEGLSAEQVTVVDSSGRVLFKGPDQGDQAALYASNQLDHKRQVEEGISKRIQGMLEGIVGKNRALVQVSADMDFEQIDVSEETYDPDGAVVRSRQRKSEQSEKGRAKMLAVQTAGADPSRGATAVAPLGGAEVSTAETAGQTDGPDTRSKKEDEVVNYEINRVTRHVVKPSGTVTRLSVAAVVDGTYEAVQGDGGASEKKYIPRSKKELEELEQIVRRAMGFNADREDQVQMSSFPLSLSTPPAEAFGKPEIDWVSLARQHFKTVFNALLVALVFLFVVRPLLRSMKGIGAALEESRSLAALQGGTSGQGVKRLPAGVGIEPDMRSKTVMLAQSNSDKTQKLIKGWLNEDN